MDLESLNVKDIFDSKLSPCVITAANPEDFAAFSFDPISILSQDPMILCEESLPKFMRKPAEWPNTSDLFERGVICEDTEVPDYDFPSKYPELLSQDELWSPRGSPFSSPPMSSSCSPALSPSRFSHDEESMDLTSLVVSNIHSTGGQHRVLVETHHYPEVVDLAAEEDEEDVECDVVTPDVNGGVFKIVAAPVSQDFGPDHHYFQQPPHDNNYKHLHKKGGRGRRRNGPQYSPAVAAGGSKKTATRNKKRKGKPGRPRKNPLMKGKKLNEMEKLKSPKTTKRKVHQSGIIHRSAKNTQSLLSGGIRTISSSAPLSPPITPPASSSSSSSRSSSLSSASSFAYLSPSSSLDSISSSSSSSITLATGSTVCPAAQMVTTVTCGLSGGGLVKGTAFRSFDDARSFGEKAKRRKCMSHTEKAVHNELERRRRAQMSELLNELRVVVDAVKDDPKASQKRIVDEALRSIKQANREEREMLARMEKVKSENLLLQARLRELSSKWNEVHGQSKAVIYRETEGEECSVVEIM